MLEAKRFLIYTLAQDLQLLSVCGVVSSLHFNVENQCVCVHVRVCWGARTGFPCGIQPSHSRFCILSLFFLKGFCSEKQL